MGSSSRCCCNHYILQHAPAASGVQHRCKCRILQVRATFPKQAPLSLTSSPVRPARKLCYTHRLSLSNSGVLSSPIASTWLNHANGPPRLLRLHGQSRASTAAVEGRAHSRTSRTTETAILALATGAACSTMEMTIQATVQMARGLTTLVAPSGTATIHRSRRCRTIFHLTTRTASSRHLQLRHQTYMATSTSRLTPYTSTVCPADSCYSSQFFCRPPFKVSRQR